MISFKKSFVFLVSAAGFASAGHLFTLVNRCGHGVNMSIDNWSRTPYNGPQPPTLGAGKSWSTTIPSGWDGRICDNRNCYGGGSMTEFNLDTGNFYTPQAYDISNIQGFTIGQQIVASGCQTVTCPSGSCPCNQAYPPGNMAGSCPNKSTVDNPVRACGAGDIAFTITYCP